MIQVDLPAGSAPSTTDANVAASSGGDMDVGTQNENNGDAQDQPTAAENQDVTDVESEMDDREDMETGDEPPTVAPEAKPRAKSPSYQEVGCKQDVR